MPATESLLERFFVPLFAGDRSAARGIVAEAFESGLASEEIIMQLIWPAMQRIQILYRADRINTGTHHMASRLLRMLADQLALRLERHERNGPSMLVVCSPGEPEELGAQITTDMAEAAGWSVHFAGGGVPNDEIVGWIGQLQPQVLMVYGTIPSACPMVRQLINLLHDVGICPKLQITLLRRRVQPGRRSGGGNRLRPLRARPRLRPRTPPRPAPQAGHARTADRGPEAPHQETRRAAFAGCSMTPRPFRAGVRR